ncbi:YtxH domain-containing protein [Pedobacter rhodius]|uniref:YtxH domain-containing protein n=1 Tax=Pedobacter rhodius TaxID=3004098 RepID=A0ABT4L0W1_9SPHI|nr:YtxH domain-containing protein [Pedobacter sp. SJ11]MCZ4224811.1 YtxH domain-containing protein [Pedobacter sp. SJ11]
MNDNSKTVVALLAGLAAGAALGILFAPDKGGETVDKLSRSLSDLKDRILDRAKDELERLVETSKEYGNSTADAYESAKEGLKEKAVSIKEEVKDSAINTIEQA